MDETGTFWKSKLEQDRDVTESLKPLLSRPRREHDETLTNFKISNILGWNQAQDFCKDKLTDESETKTYQ